MEVARIIMTVAGAYTAIGVVFALAFVVAGVGRVDAGAKGAGVLFRVLIVPAAAALWPVMLVKWVCATPGGHQ